MTAERWSMRSPDGAKRNPGTALLEGTTPDCARQEPGSIRATIVHAARSWSGTPYRHQGALKGVGCDCLGLLIGVWREICEDGRDAAPPRVPAYTPDWAEASGAETLAEGLRKYLVEMPVAEAREGDVVLFRWRAHLPAKHAAILTGRDRMVHAQEHAAVTDVPVTDWWRRRMAYAFSLAGGA